MTGCKSGIAADEAGIPGPVGVFQHPTPSWMAVSATRATNNPVLPALLVPPALLVLPALSVLPAPPVLSNPVLAALPAPGGVGP